MARETEELLIALRADLNQFEKNFAKAHGISVGQMRKIQRQVEGDATKIERRMAAMGASIKGSLLAAFTVGGATALIGQLDDAIKRIADLAEAAESAGVSVEQLQQLTYAGGAAGLDQGKIVSGLQRLNKELAKAKAEGKEVGTTFDEFLKLADNVAAAGTAVEKTGIATEKLGKAGAQYLPLLNQGAAGLKQQFGEAALASDELAKAADEFYDKWALGLTNWQTLFNSTISSILVSLDVLSTRMTDRTKAQLEFRRSEILASLSKIKWDIFADAPGGSNELRAELEDIEERLRLLSRIPKPPLLQTGAGEADTETEPAAETAKKIADRIGDMTTEIEKIPEALPALTEMQEAMGEVKDAFKDAFSDLAVAAGDGKLKLEEVIDVVDSLRDRMIRMAAEKLFELIFNTLVNSQQPGSFPIPGRAGGGPVNAGQPYVVGEHRPELFVPSRSGKILPKVGGAGGGGGGDVTINNYAGAQVSTQRSGPSGRDLIVLIEQIGDARFARNLSQNAPLIGGRPVSKRTS